MAKKKMPRKRGGKVQMSFWASPELAAKIDKAAERDGRNRANWMHIVCEREATKTK